MFLWIGHNVAADWVQQVFGVQSAAQIDIDKVRSLYFTVFTLNIQTRPLDKSVIFFFSYFSTKTYVVGAQKNCLNETVLLNTQNIC